MEAKISEIQAWVDEKSPIAEKILQEVRKVIVGQTYLLERLLIGLLSDGHLLLEGVPGLAKTLSISTLAKTLSGVFKRIQFTPDFLPADITGTMIYQPQTQSFSPHKGPIFANFVLADEINRAPAKVQSALLEAMQERQVTLGDKTYPLPQPFLVMATQNPIEQEGTYPLPEAQVDRFLAKVKITYPSPEEEMEIINRVALKKLYEPSPVATLEDILDLQERVRGIYVDERIKHYVIKIVDCTRHPKKYGLDLEPFIRYGASPRASLYLITSAQSYAFLKNRAFVTPDDIKTLAPDILRHRILLSYEAEAEGMNVEEIIREILDTVEAP